MYRCKFKYRFHRQPLPDKPCNGLHMFPDEKMIPAEPADSTAVMRIEPPLFQLFGGQGIPLPCQYGNRSSYRSDIGWQNTGLCHPEIAAKQKQKKSQHLRTAQHFRWGAAEPGHLKDKFVVRQRMDSPFTRRLQMRRALSRNKEMCRRCQIGRFHFAGRQVGQQTTHAMAEKSERQSIRKKTDNAAAVFCSCVDITIKRF